MAFPDESISYASISPLSLIDPTMRIDHILTLPVVTMNVDLVLTELIWYWIDYLSCAKYLNTFAYFLSLSDNQEYDSKNTVDSIIVGKM